jgi:hypothetical protein
VPDGLYEALLTKLPASAHVMTVVEAAATIGRYVDRDLLRSVVSLADADFDNAVRQLVLVLASRLARSAAPQLGRHGLGLMGGALTAGILVGYVFVVPGLGTVSIAGLLDIPLATMLVYGLLIGPLTAVLTVLLYSQILKLAARGRWHQVRTAAGAVPSLAPPGMMTTEPRMDPVPAVGEHTCPILAELGLVEDEIEALVADRVV